MGEETKGKTKQFQLKTTGFNVLRQMDDSTATCCACIFKNDRRVSRDNERAALFALRNVAIQWATGAQMSCHPFIVLSE